jgi:ATPase subunit of ABC transporter with duplicated ATPase domains
MPVSSRKYPFISFKPARPCGNTVLEIEGLSKKIQGVDVLNHLTFTVHNEDRIAVVGNSLAKTTLLRILAGEMEPDGGSFRWGPTITSAYFPKDHGSYFKNDLTLIDWLCQFPPCDSEGFARGFLGRMLFSGDEATKKVSVLSGGEKVRCMLAKTMLTEANVLMLDEPTNHLDLESLTALNNGLIAFPEVLLLVSQDHQLVSTVANRIVEITPAGIIDRVMGFDEYLENSAGERVTDSLAAAS